MRAGGRHGFVLLILISALLGSSCRTYAEAGGSQDTFQKLEKLTQARELYMAGESAYKAGKLEDAAACWLKALQFKPDSDYTKQCLAKAQKQLSTKYQTLTSQRLKGNDRVSAYLAVKSLSSYVPGDPALSAKAEEIKGQMTPYEVKALDAYSEAGKFCQKKNYEKAQESIRLARQLAPISETLKDAATTIQSALDATNSSKMAAAKAKEPTEPDADSEPSATPGKVTAAKPGTQPKRSGPTVAVSAPRPSVRPTYTAKRQVQVTRRAMPQTVRGGPRISQQPARQAPQPIRSRASCST